MTRPSWQRGVRAAFVFLTRIPVGGFPYRPNDFRWAAAYFPLVGAVVGILSGLVFWLTSFAGPVVAGLCSVAASVLLTGGFHEDGLADTADALGGSHDRSRIFVILKDSRLGTFGVLALILALGLRVALFARLEHAPVWAGLLSGGLARTPPVWMMATMKYVTDETSSRSKPVIQSGWPQAVVASLIAGLILSVAMLFTSLQVMHAVLLVAVLTVVARIAASRFKVRAGGITGDFLGATEQIGECTVLLVLVQCMSA